MRPLVQPSQVSSATNVQPLRILFAVPTSWTETLGLPRVAIELAQHLSAMGHHCEKFSHEDAFPRGVGKASRFFSTALYQRALLRHIQLFGYKYDVISAEHDLLPYPRDKYRFKGTLIAKSNGLMHFYRQYQEKVEPKLKQISGKRGSVSGNLMRQLGWRAAGGIAAVNQSFAAADQIHLLNEDELRFVSVECGWGRKCRSVPNGLSSLRANALESTATVEARNGSDTVAFVGMWSLRKGSVEFPQIIRAIRLRRPSTRFHLIGTLESTESVLGCFSPLDRSQIVVTPRFEPDKLPSLLASAKCGLFPSYIEGFGLGVLEMLAAGMPVVAWDVPGPRQLLRNSDAGVLTTPGDYTASADAVLHLMSCSDYPVRARAALAASKQYRWEQIARDFVANVLDRSCRVPAMHPQQ